MNCLPEGFKSLRHKLKKLLKMKRHLRNRLKCSYVKEGILNLKMKMKR